MLIPISVIVLLVYFAFRPYWVATYEGVPFDSTTWRSNIGDMKPFSRIYMIDDLLDRCNLAGRTRTEILELLGPAEPLENVRVLHGSVEPSGADFYDLREIHGRHAGWLVVEFSGDVATRARWER